MKKSDIEKQLKKDLSASAPSDFGAVWNKCTAEEADGRELVPEAVPVTAHDGHASERHRRSRIAVAAATLAVLLCVAAILCIALFGKSGGNFVLPSHSGYFTIDVNPSVQVNYGSDGVVTAAQGLNSDGKELLNGLELEGLTYDKAADAIFDACELHGYFSVERDDNAILMTASRDSGEKDDIMTAEINKRLLQKFENKKMKGVVISDVDNAKWQKEAEKYGINSQKYDFIMRYLEMGGELDEGEFSTITVRELYSLISNIENNSKDK